MTLEQLLIFITAAETLSFSETGRRLLQSQPSISQQMKSLETELGVSLFERSYRQLVLTAAGEILYPYALRIRQELESARSAINEMQGEITGPLRLGGSTTNGNYLLPKFLVQLKALHPLIQVTMIIENGANLLESLNRGKVDILLLEGPKPQPMSKRYEITPFYDDQLVVVKNPQFKLKKTALLAYYAQCPWIMREAGSGTREILIKNFESHQIPFEQINVKMELGTIEAVKQALSSTEALGYLSPLAVERELSLGQLEIVHVKALNIVRQLWLVRPTNFYLTAPMKAFISLLNQLTIGA